MRYVNWDRLLSMKTAKSYGLSLFITGVGSTKALAKAANSKIGKVTMEFTANMVGELMKSYNKGEFNDENGSFDMDKFLNSDFQGLMQGALIEALVAQGFSKKAEELSAKLNKAQANLAKQESKLNKSLNNGASEKTIANRTAKVDKAQKEVVKTMGKTGAVSTSKEVVGKGTNKANEKRRKK